jgi:hypothetical protein
LRKIKLKRKLKELKDKFKLMLGDKLMVLKDKLVLKDKPVLRDRLKELVLALADRNRIEEMRNRSLVRRLIREMAGRLRIWDFRVRRTLIVERGIL